MIQLKNVSKYYYSKGMISSGISKVDLTLEIGEFVVITGESGSGKTTLLNVISGLDSYEEGEMYIDGTETSHYRASDFEDYRKRYIGNIFQHYNLVNSYTVYQNIELILLINGYSRDEIKRRVPDIIKRVGLESHAGTKVSKLSGGQKQRVSIARALAKDTDIIVADEPTGNLDSVSAEGIVELLSEIAHDKLVIVVTHNYDQFAEYVTRKIKMHDGRVVEDIRLKEDEGLPAFAVLKTEDARREHMGREMSAASKLRLGVRNTFNIFPKFILMLAVFMFVVFAVTSQYTAFRNQEAEEDRLGYNDYFYNYSENRVVLKKSDGSAFTGDDSNAINNVANVETVAVNDILLDTPLYIENEDTFYEAYPRSLREFDGTLVTGRMPEADNEVIFTAVRDEFDANMIEALMDRTFQIDLGEDTAVNLTIVGFAYKETNDGVFTYTGELFATDQMISTILTETYSYNSTVTTLVNGKEQQYVEGNSFYRIVPNSRVAAGQAFVAEELNNFYDENDGVRGKTITVTASNILYTQSADLTVSEVYTSRTFESITGIADYESHNGTIYVSPDDYAALFAKGNYQASVYVRDVDDMAHTLEAMEAMGYTTLPLKDTLISMFSDLTSIIRVPITVVVIVALFFIAYFVIRLILRSRTSYFSILRMLGLARRNIRRILDVEMLLTVNIAYAIFLLCVILVNKGFINIQYIADMVAYIGAVDYVILYAVMIVMAYLISGKFARNLFKKTAMGAYREEE